MLKILIVGAGAIGCFVGGRLAAGGQAVTLLGRPPLMDKIVADGLCLRQPTLSEQIVFPKTAASLTELSSAYDFVLISVKSPDTLQVAEELVSSGLPLENSYIVSLQNGIGNEEQLADTFGRKRVMAGTLTIPISVPEEGVIAINKNKGGLGLATLDPLQPAQRLAKALTQAGLTTSVYKDYQAMKWSKLLLNIINNASSAILDEPPSRIIANPDLFNMEIAALVEGVQVMNALGLSVVNLPGYPVKLLAQLIQTPWLPLAAKRAILGPFMVSGRGAKMPSLHIDLAAGRATSEVAVLNGAIVEAGRTLEVTTPVNRTLTTILNGIVSGELEWSDYQQQPDKLLETVSLFI